MESLQLCSQPHLTLAPELKKPYAGAEGSWHPLAICGEDLGPAQVWPAQASWEPQTSAMLLLGCLKYPSHLPGKIPSFRTHSQGLTCSMKSSQLPPHTRYKLNLHSTYRSPGQELPALLCPAPTQHVASLRAVTVQFAFGVPVLSCNQKQSRTSVPVAHLSNITGLQLYTNLGAGESGG